MVPKVRRLCLEMGWCRSRCQQLIITVVPGVGGLSSFEGVYDLPVSIGLNFGNS